MQNRFACPPYTRSIHVVGVKRGHTLMHMSMSVHPSECVSARTLPTAADEICPLKC